MPMIKTDKLSKCYGAKTAVNALNLTVEKGELFSLLGVNGAGKTTTIKMLCCLTRPTDGDAEIGGNSIRNAPDRVKEIIAVSPQETAVAPNLSVRENLTMFCDIAGRPRSDVDTMLKEFHLDEVAKQKAATLSGGWQRRLSIAMALVSEPEVLFLDEPTLGLDVIARHELWNTIRALHGRMTVILTTHYLEEAEQLSDRIGIMSNGTLCACGTPQEIIAVSGEKDFESAFIKLATGGTTDKGIQ